VMLRVNEVNRGRAHREAIAQPEACDQAERRGQAAKLCPHCGSVLTYRRENTPGWVYRKFCRKCGREFPLRQAPDPACCLSCDMHTDGKLGSCRLFKDNDGVKDEQCGAWSPR